MVEKLEKPPETPKVCETSTPSLVSPSSKSHDQDVTPSLEVYQSPSSSSTQAQEPPPSKSTLVPGATTDAFTEIIA